MESVKICKKEIDESLETLDWVAKKMKNNDNFKYLSPYIVNAIGIIAIFTDVLIEHTKKGNKDEQKSDIETTS